VNVTELWNDESSELRRMLQSHVVADHRLNSQSFYNNLRLQTLSSQFIHLNVLHSVRIYTQSHITHKKGKKKR